MTSWATHLIEALERGKTVRFRPRGNSMKGKIESGDLVEVRPVGDTHPKPGDVVLCRVAGSTYLHFVKAIGDRGYLIGNAHGHLNGWTKRIYGILTEVNPLV